MGRNKAIQCEVCMKNIRSDHFKTHRKQHKTRANYPMKRCTICNKNMIASNLKRHEKVHNDSLRQIRDNVQHDQSEYDNAIKIGEMVKETLNSIDVDVKSLRKEYVQALELNTSKTCSPLDGFGALKLWQKDLLKIMKPSERDIIWVTGQKGREGKSYFQGFIEQHYGSKRVFRCSIINKKSEAVLHMLSKMSLAFIDVFVFNIPRCFDPAAAPYSLFEGIKDGQAISAKYDSKALNFLKPNILIVFSNGVPNLAMASRDRWKTYHIVDDKLQKKAKIEKTQSSSRECDLDLRWYNASRA